MYELLQEAFEELLIDELGYRLEDGLEATELSQKLVEIVRQTINKELKW